MSCHVCAEGAQRCVCETPMLDMWVDGMLSLVTHSSSHQVLAVLHEHGVPVRLITRHTRHTRHTHSSSHQVLAVLHEHGVPVDGTECETLLGQTPLELATINGHERATLEVRGVHLVVRRSPLNNHDSE